MKKLFSSCGLVILFIFFLQCQKISQIGAIIPKLVLNISSTNTLSGSIISVGNTRVTEFGFVWSESGSTPTITNNVGLTKITTIVNKPPRDFIYNLTLSGAGNYNVCAYATNNGGTGYSDVKTLTIIEARSLEIPLTISENSIKEN